MLLEFAPFCTCVALSCLHIYLPRSCNSTESSNIQCFIALLSHEDHEAEQDLEGVLCDEDTYKKRAWFETYCSEAIR